MYIFIILPLFIIGLTVSMCGIFSSFFAEDYQVDFVTKKVSASAISVVDESTKAEDA